MALCDKLLSLTDVLFNYYRWYRKRRGGKWYKVTRYPRWQYYWTQGKLLASEHVIQEENW